MMTDTFSNKFVADKNNLSFLQKTLMGPNGIRQAEELASHFPITKDMRILDLGAGMGLSSLYLVKEFGTKVFVTDFYIDPTENYERFQSIGIADKTVPMMLDATQPFPFAKNYFDVIFSVGAYNLFGANEEMLPKLISYVKKGGYIAVAFPGLKFDFGDNVPQEMKRFWNEPEVASLVRGIEWWKNLWSKTEGCNSGCLEIVNISEQTCHNIAWQEYLANLNPSNQDNKWADELNSNIGDEQWILDMMEAEGGKYFNTIQLIAKVV